MSRHGAISFADAVWGSFGSGWFYRSTVRVPWYVTLALYVFCLTLLAVTNTALERAGAMRAFDRFYEKHGRHFPHLTIGEDNVVSATGAALPYVAEIGSGSPVRLVVDMDGAWLRENGASQAIIATTDAVLVPGLLGHRRMGWDELRPLLSLVTGDAHALTPEGLAAGREPIVNLLTLYYGMVALVQLVLFTGLGILMFAWLGRSMAATRKCLISWLMSLHIALFAMVPPSILYALAFAIDFELPQQVVVSICMLVYSFIAVRGFHLVTSPEPEEEGPF